MPSRLSLFEDLDRMNAEAWVAHLAPDVVMQFGNADPVYGRDGCRRSARSLFRRVDGISHHIVARWNHGESTIVEATVTFARRDDTEVTIPTVTIWRTNGRGLIADYRVYLDPAPIWDAPDPV